MVVRPRRHHRPLHRACCSRAAAINATVTLTHTGTGTSRSYLRRGDVIVAAAGVKHLVTGARTSSLGAAVLDVGVTREDDPETGKSKVYGDIAPDVAEVAGLLSPNPGGVGPMTVALLMTRLSWRPPSARHPEPSGPTPPAPLASRTP